MNKKYTLSAIAAAALAAGFATFSNPSQADCTGPTVPFFQAGGSSCTGGGSSGTSVGSSSPNPRTLTVNLNFVGAGDDRAQGQGLDLNGVGRCNVSDLTANGSPVVGGCANPSVVSQRVRVF